VTYMKIKGFFKDVSGASRVTKRREELFNDASSVLTEGDPINEVAKQLHPGPISVKVSKVEDVSPTARKFTFVPLKGELPPFQAGQYASLELNIDKTITTRPYSICSAPFQARSEHPFFEITVRNGKADGFAANWIYANLHEGMELKANLPFGHFYIEELRDAKNIVGLAGGSGITPFYSMAQEIAHGTLDANLTILYGSVSSKDIILFKELSAVKSDKVKFINVISGEPDYKGEKGFINRDIIKKYSEGDTSYFVCGPLPMYTFIKGELEALKVPERRIRMEVFGAPRDISKAKGYPSDMLMKTFSLTVIRGIQKDVIPAKASEPLVVAMERAGIPTRSCCRSGECGYCRCKLVSGNVFVPNVGDGRRTADKEMGYIHSCSSYPLSDVTIKVPII
jgi:ferredoxin-NADP reductase